MENDRTRKITLCGMFSAIVAIGTAAIAIPVPATNGYINLGDGIIVAIAFLFGGYYGMIAGAIGSALADVVTGYAHWAVFTFFIKGLMGYAAGMLFDRKKHSFSLKNILAVFVAEFIMVLGYFLCGGIILGSLAVSFVSVPSNMIQGFGAFFVFFALAETLRRVSVFKKG